METLAQSKRRLRMYGRPKAQTGLGLGRVSLPCSRLPE